MTKTIRPIHRRIAVQLDARESETSGGIVLPENAQEVQQWGEVLAVAPDCEIITEPGTRVLVTSTQGTNIGNDIILIEEDKIKAVEG